MHQQKYQNNRKHGSETWSGLSPSFSKLFPINTDIIALHKKPYFLFPNVLKRWSFQKIAMEYDLFCIITKDDICFSQKYDIFSLDGKWKMTFLKKIQENMTLFVYLYKCYKYDISILPKKQRWSSPKKRHLKVTFLASLKIWYSSYKMWYFCWSTILIDILDWHSRKSLNDSLYFYGDL